MSEKKGVPAYASGQPVDPPPVYSEKPPPYQQQSTGAYPAQPGGPPQGYHTQAMAQGAFDTGARFNSIAKPNVPPPPPGVMPTQAQVAAAQGQSVMMQQKKSDWVSGSGDGGGVYTGFN